MFKTEEEMNGVELTAAEVWELRRHWHDRCVLKAHELSADQLNRHTKVCDALESLARCLETRNDPSCDHRCDVHDNEQHICDFTSVRFNFGHMAHRISLL